jgi:hypothetical protein
MFYNLAMPRHCSPDTKYFQRVLSPADRAVLMAAGAGDISDGFREILAVYATLWNAGMRPGQIENFLQSDMQKMHNDSIA